MIVRALIKQAFATKDTTYVTGKAGRGSGQHVLVLGGTGYIGKALVSELGERGYKPVLLARRAQAKEAYPHAEIVIGDVTQKADVEKVFNAFMVEAVITLLSSRRPNDEDECHGPVNYSIVRPTSYYPHLAINFGEVQNDKPRADGFLPGSCEIVVSCDSLCTSVRQ